MSHRENPRKALKRRDHGADNGGMKVAHYATVAALALVLSALVAFALTR